MPRNLRAEDDCTPIINAANATVQKYKVLVADQDNLIVKLTEQRNDAIKQQNNSASLGEVFLWTLVGGAAATVIIGIRR